MKCHRGGSSEGLMAFNGCSLAEVRGDYVWGGTVLSGEPNWKHLRNLKKEQLHELRHELVVDVCCNYVHTCSVGLLILLGKALAGVPAAVDQAPRWIKINDGPFMIWKKLGNLDKPIKGCKISFDVF